MITFVIDGLPIAKGRGRVGRHGQVYTPARTRDAERYIATVALQHRPSAPFTGPLVLEVDFVFPIPHAWPRWKRAAALASEWRPIGKPDVSNLLKTVEDALNGVMWLDDSQICDVTGRKWYGAEPRTIVTIRLAG